MNDLEQFYSRKEEPVKSCLQALRRLVLAQHPQITEAWKYRMPFFCYRGKMLCYAWVDRKTEQPYMGIVQGRQIEHPALLQDKRAKMKILPLDPEQELPEATVRHILGLALALYPENG